jgi:dicarboxylate/amino acid:cation (Na+ or H+) symporter, DAACS family
MQLWLKIFIGLIAGALFGWLLTLTGMEAYADYFQPLGDTFMNLIKMLIVLLVFSSMTLGVTSIHDPKKLGRVGLKSLLMYFFTTLIAISIGLFFAYLMRPGSGIEFKVVQAINVKSGPGFKDILFNIIPQNPIQALAEGNVLQIIVFSVFLGIAINLTGDKARPLLKFLDAIAEVMYTLTSIIMEFAPYGVFAIMTWVVGSYGVKVLGSLAEFLICNYLACFVHMILVFGGLLIFVLKLNPWSFFKGMGDAIAFAFSTNSSSATLPVSLHCVQENLGVSKNISNFVLPLGATVNMNGAAISQAISAVFISQAYGIDLAWGDILMIVTTATLSAVGAAGIPGSTIIMLTVVLSSAGLPLEGILLISGVDRIREMMTTVVNVLGDAVVAIYVARTEGELDINQYNQADLVEMEESDI